MPEQDRTPTTASDIEAMDWPREPDQDLHERNIAFLTERFPIAGRLKNYTPGAELTFLENGEPTVILGETSLYEDTGALSHTARQYEQFWQRPTNTNLTPPSGDGMDEYTKAFAQKILKWSIAEGIDFFVKPSHRRSDHVMVFGVGLGAHLMALLRDTQCHSMLLIEPNLEFIYHSTFVFDWEAFFREAEEQNCKVDIITLPNADAMFGAVKQSMMESNVMTFDGTLFYTHYPNQFFTTTIKRLQKEIVSFLIALGYTEDEFFMLENTFGNFAKADSKLFQPHPDAKLQAPVIIVGGGPSKDDYYDVLRANQDKAVIISCGSAMESLLHEGIIPDFHFVIERGTQWYDLLEAAAKKWDLSQICFVGSSTVDQRIRNLFGDAAYFYRAGLSPYQMLGKSSNAWLKGCDPQVANAGFSFALHTGFREFYFFGLDLGSRDPELHHSRNSFPMLNDKVKKRAFDISVPGSLGGTVYTNSHLIFVRENIEHMGMHFKSGRTFINCSDGVRIKGAVPKVPRNLTLPEPGQPKAEVVKKMIAGFKLQPATEYRAQWDAYDVRARATAVKDDIMALLDEHPDLWSQDFFSQLNTYIRTSVTRPQADATIIYKGNLNMIMMTAWYYLMRLDTDEHRAKYNVMFRDVFDQALGDMVADTIELVDRVESELPA